MNDAKTARLSTRTIQRLAAECAATAGEQGYHHPWGDGDLLPGDLAALRELLGREETVEEARLFRAAFESALPGNRVYTATDEGGVSEVLYAESWAAALEQAGDWALGGDYGAELRTVRGTVVVTGPDGDERTVEWSKDPEEPQCPEGGHEWTLDENGVWGLEGAAVSTSETCTLCGLHKTTVTGDVSTPSRNGVDYSRD